MGTPDVESLKIAFSTASTLNEWATVVVVLGVVLELAALLIFGKDMSRVEKMMLVVGSVLVVLGVGGEYIFGGRASAAAARLQQISDEKITEVKSDAAHAIFQAAILGVQEKNLDQYVKDQKKRVDAAIADLRSNDRKLATAREDAAKSVAEAKSILANMNGQLAAIRELRQKMEVVVSKQSQRHLTEVQKGFAAQQLARWAVVPAPKPLKGQPLGGKQVGYFGAYPETVEGNNFAADFRDIFKMAGWDTCCGPGWSVMTGQSQVPVMAGIRVLFPENSPRANKIVDAFVDAMKSVNVPVTKVPVSDTSCQEKPITPREILEEIPTCTWISVVVGEHP